jgi:hypothetical protein
MGATVTPDHLSTIRARLAGADPLFYFSVLIAYVVATAMSVSVDHLGPDSMMLVAERALGGHLDSDALKGVVDSAYVGGHYYMVLGPAQLVAYLPFAAVPALHDAGRYLVCLLFGVPAAWLSLPVARAFGARGATAMWIASFVAFGSLLFYVSTVGDVYYLAHAQSFLGLMLFLLEWSGRRRPVLLGAALALSFLARPTTIFAAVPFGVALLWGLRGRRSAAVLASVAFAVPLLVALAILGWYNWARFGSPLESGYAISYITEPSLIARRAVGIFSIGQVPENLRLFLLAPPQTLLPFPIADRAGMSMLLVSPALLTALWAGFRERSAQLMWLSTALVAVPVFLYYGGGFVQYGFRYSLDFTPFLVALMATGSSRWIGWLERLLIVFSCVSVTWGMLLDMAWHHYT